MYKAIVVGGGPAGLAAALAASQSGKILLIEREERTGGILKQCVHDGFGVIRFGEKLSGPEYAERFAEKVYENPNIELKLLTYVIDIKKEEGKVTVVTTSSGGIREYEGENLILACGCRERTPRQINVHGTRPAGLMTAGTAQHYVNLMGYLPAKRAVILGSGDIGLIMARRLTLEGAEVVGVYEAKPTPSGLMRNVEQCLRDFGIPLHLSKTVTRVFGNNRVEGAEIASVNEKMEPIPGTEERVDCDAVIVSVGLIPENELAEKLNIPIDPATRGPYVDQNAKTLVDGVYSVGNALHVHDLADYVSEISETAGKSAGKRGTRSLVQIKREGFLYFIPQYIDVGALEERTTVYFRSCREYDSATLRLKINGEEVFKKKYTFLRPSEMERLKLPLRLKEGDEAEFILEGGDG